MGFTKKIISILLAAGLLCGLTACGDNSEEVAESSVATSSVADDFSSADASSTVEESSASVEPSTLDESSSASDAGSNAAVEHGSEASSRVATDSKSSGSISGTKLQAMADKISNWDKGNVLFTTKIEQGELTSEVFCDSFGDSSYCSMEIGDLMYMTMLRKDGKIYMLDAPSKSYALMDNGKVSQDDFDFVMLALSEDMQLSASGTETINGKSYAYEEYQLDKEDGVNDCVRYYFDDKGDACYMSYADVSETYYPLTIEFKEKVDDTNLKLPADYKEISSEEMTEIQFQNIMGLLGAALGGLDDSEE